MRCNDLCLLVVFLNSYIFNGATHVTLIFQQRWDTPWVSVYMVNALKQDQGERCNGFFLFLMVTYLVLLHMYNIYFSTKTGILNGFVCNMFFVNIEIKVFSVCGENTNMGIFS